MAVLAVYARTLRVLRREGGNDGIIPLLRARVKIGKILLQLFHIGRALHDGQDGGTVERVLDALRGRERLSERGFFRVEQLARVERLHDGNADALFFAAGIEAVALGGAADGELSVAIVVHRVDGEHHHVQNSHVQHAAGELRRVGGQADVLHNALRFEFKQIAQNAVSLVSLQITNFIQTVHEAEVDVIGLQLLQLPRDGSFDAVQRRVPAVFAGGIVRTEMQLQIRILSPAGKGFSDAREDDGVAAREIDIVDAAVQRKRHRFHDVLNGVFSDDGGSEADDADLLGSVGQLPVFHTIHLIKTYCTPASAFR